MASPSTTGAPSSTQRFTNLARADVTAAAGTLARLQPTASHVVPYIANACAVEAAFYIIRSTGSGLLPCNQSVALSTSSPVARQVKRAIEALTPKEVDAAYLELANTVMAIAQSRKHQFPEFITCWGHLAVALPQFAFHTVLVKSCRCANDKTSAPNRLSHIPIHHCINTRPELFYPLRTVSEVCRIFFTEHVDEDDRLPSHLAVEWQAPSTPTEIAQHLNFPYEMADGTTAQAEFSKITAVVMTGTTGAPRAERKTSMSHFHAALMMQGVEGDTVYKDSLRRDKSGKPKRIMKRTAEERDAEADSIACVLMKRVIP